MTLDFNRFEILTFDCYGTLIDWETGLLSALHRILSAHGKKVEDATLLELYGNFEQRSEQTSERRVSSLSRSSAIGGAEVRRRVRFRSHG